MTPPSPLVGATLERRDWVFLVVILILVGFAATMAMAETALSRISRVKAMAMEEEGRRGAKRLSKLISRPEQFLNTVLLLVLLCQTVAATLLSLVADKYGAWGVAGATAFEVCFIFVVAEVIPKTWAIQHTEKAALRAAAYVAPIATFWPLRMMSRALIVLSNILMPGRGLPQGPTTSEEEILATTEVAADEGVIEQQERRLIHSIIKFGDTVAKEVMVPRPDMVTAQAEQTVRAVLETALSVGYSRLPVYENQIDDILGLVYLKDLVAALNAGKGDEPVREEVRQANVVPESKRVADLMREMQRGKYHMAIVIDEYGGVSGLVALEDLIEELVGEITDEYDADEATFEHMGDGAVRVPAAMPVDELNELLGVELPEHDDYESVGGLVLAALGHVPAEGESVVIDRRRLTAQEVQGRRIGRVLVAPVTEDTDDAAAGKPGLLSS